MLFDVNSILEQIKNGAIQAAQKVAVSALKEAAEDAVDFVGIALPSINRYTELLITRRITAEEFSDLMLGLKDVAEMSALTQAGLAAIEVDKTRNAIVKTVTDVVLGTVTKFL